MGRTASLACHGRALGKHGEGWAREVPGLNSWEQAEALEPGQSSARLPMSSWEPSPGHWEHSPAPSTRPGRKVLVYVARKGQPQPSGHPRPHPACPVPSLEEHPSKGTDGCGTPGIPAVPPPQNTGPNHQLRISLKCIFLSFLHGVPKPEEGF